VYETALVVSFMRPFVGTLRLPTTYYTPPGPNQVQLFKDMKALRDSVCAYGRGTGRVAGPITIRVEGELVNLTWNAAPWHPERRLPPDEDDGRDRAARPSLTAARKACSQVSFGLRPVSGPFAHP
jgi:hypothetical protein